MPELILAATAVLFGFVGLAWGADKFVDGSAAIALRLGLSKLIIGLTIVSLGTSAPEILVAISASLKHSGDLAVGNALGSNLANIGLVLAVTAIISPIPFDRRLLLHEIPLLLAVTGLAGAVLFNAVLQVSEGVLLAALIVPVIGLLFWLKHNIPSASLELTSDEQESLAHKKVTTPLMLFALGLIVLLISSESLVWGARTLAQHFGVSPLVIGLTVVAIGTSLPELAASLASALKNHHDLAIGNIIGSNIFNILAVVAVPALFGPTLLDSDVFNRDYVSVMAITLALAMFLILSHWRARRTKAPAKLARATGIALLVGYLCYYLVIFYR